MKVEEFFTKGRNLEKELRQLEIAREEAFLLASKAIVTISGEIVSSCSSNGTESKFINYADYSEKIDLKIEELKHHRERMIDIINKLNSTTYRTLLLARYVNCSSWEKVAEAIGYGSEKWVRTKLHKKALCAAEEYYLELPD